MNKTSVNIARLVYLLVCQAAGVAIALSTTGTEIEVTVTTGLLVGLGVGAIFIGIERLMEGFSLRGFSTGAFGLGVGLFCAWLLTRVGISDLLELALRHETQDSVDGAALIGSLKLAFDITLFASLGFIGTALALQSNRDDFAFIIPYVRFREDASSGQPFVIDAETIMDGRILGLLSSGFLTGRMIIAQDLLEEIQTLANQGANGTRQRAQRGLENLEKMRSSPDIQISIHDAKRIQDGKASDNILISTAKFYGARLLTLDESLSKVARLQGLSVLNLNDLDLALRPFVAIGERLRVALVRPGKEEHQAVAYLQDGTMIVVNHAAEMMGKSVEIVVVTSLQTASGTLIFAERAGS